MTRPNAPSAAYRGFAIMAFVVIILAGIKAASPIVVPFVLSSFLAVVCNPAIGLMTRFRLPKWLAVILLMGFIVLMGLWLASVVGSSINEFSKQLPQYRVQLIEQFEWILQKLDNFNIRISKDQVLAYFDPGMALSMTTNMLSGVGNVMANLFLIILTIVFMLFEAQSLPKKLHLALDDPDMRLQQIERFLQSVNQYMVIKTLVSLATGIIVGIGLSIIGVDYALLWAVVAFLFNYIPNIGSIIAAIPAVLLAFIQLGPAAAGATTLLYVGVNMIMGNIIEPKFMGRGLGLSTLVVFLSLIFWGWLLGSVGMLLSVPLTMVVKIALESSKSGNWLAILLSDDVDDDYIVNNRANETSAGDEIDTSTTESK
ncbi:AI-2E family transporter [Shewanella morhuae]|uniref:AI-2E family transporter n=1 Tax=Shewanella morhuae TaxID=365591 RepID=A0A1N6YFJ7_9GAMM|nr:AI-2E family transporter [Shewanella morhuae]PTA50602.1 AI-2E family transporter [Shewanella morhuae]GIU09963.1 membrane protein [Shewanella morhuae]SIR13334.1 Predicted PurR-regulated permease PerM [Shewanella morhuae]SUI73610.1 Transport of quorum-sensing signal protein [Shewanella morhuae]